MPTLLRLMDVKGIKKKHHPIKNLFAPFNLTTVIFGYLISFMFKVNFQKMEALLLYTIRKKIQLNKRLGMKFHISDSLFMLKHQQHDIISLHVSLLLSKIERINIFFFIINPSNLKLSIFLFELQRSLETIKQTAKEINGS